MTDQRYHLTLTSAGQPVMHGWWGSEATARRKFRTWIGEYGAVEGAGVTLVDEVEARTLAAWPGDTAP